MVPRIIASISVPLSPVLGGEGRGEGGGLIKAAVFQPGIHLAGIRVLLLGSRDPMGQIFLLLAITSLTNKNGNLLAIV